MRQQKATTPPARGAARKAQPSDSDGGDSDDDDGARARETVFWGDLGDGYFLGVGKTRVPQS